jgi:hypothetical protein
MSLLRSLSAFQANRGMEASRVTNERCREDGRRAALRCNRARLYGQYWRSGRSVVRNAVLLRELGYFGAAALTVQAGHVEQYLAAAQALMTEFFARPATDPWHTRYITRDYTSGNADCMQQILTNFASKAWRRPAAESELAPYLALGATQPTPQQGLTQAIPERWRGA